MLHADTDDIDNGEDEPLVPLGDVYDATDKVRASLVQSTYHHLSGQLKEPPNAIVAEREVVGDILVFGASALRLCEEANLDADHFSSKLLGSTYAAAKACAARGDAIATSSILDAHLRAGNTLDDVGGELWLQGLVAHALHPNESAFLALRIASCVRSIIEKAQMRGAIDVARKLAARAHVGDGHPSDLIAEAVAALGALDAVTESGPGIKDNRSIMRSVRASMPALGGTRIVVPTGLIDVDKYFAGGTEPGDLVIIAARPSMGKTQLALDVADHLAVKKHRRVMIFSLEMSSRQLMARLAGARSNLDTRRATMTREEQTELLKAMGELEESGLIIDDRGGVTIGQLRARARQEHLKEPLTAIVLDYLQLLDEGKRTDGDSRDAMIGEWTKGLKKLARELEVTVYALSQLNRGVEQRVNKRPMMSDLRESGNIEQDADIICFLYREEYYERDRTPEDKKGIAELIVAKNRNGAAGASIRMRFAGNTPRFQALATDEEPPFGGRKPPKTAASSRVENTSRFTPEND